MNSTPQRAKRKDRYAASARSGLPQNFRHFMRAALLPVTLPPEEPEPPAVKAPPTWPFSNLTPALWNTLPPVCREALDQQVTSILEFWERELRTTSKGLSVIARETNRRRAQ